MKSLKLQQFIKYPFMLKREGPTWGGTGLAPHQGAVLDSECEIRRIFLTKCRHWLHSLSQLPSAQSLSIPLCLSLSPPCCEMPSLSLNLTKQNLSQGTWP